RRAAHSRRRLSRRRPRHGDVARASGRTWGVAALSVDGPHVSGVGGSAKRAGIALLVGGQRVKPAEIRTLSVCSFGLREPLVQTQVLPYLRELSRAGAKVWLLTFEPSSTDWT